MTLKKSAVVGWTFLLLPLGLRAAGQKSLVDLCVPDDLRCQQQSYCQVSALYLGETGGFRYSLARYCEKQRHKVTLERSPSTSQKPEDLQEIDTLYVDATQGAILESQGLCRKRGKIDPELFAVVWPEPVQFRRALKAWRADRKQGKIIPVSARGVDCENEAYGT